MRKLLLGLFFMSAFAHAQEAVPGEFLIRTRGNSSISIANFESRGLKVKEEINAREGLYLVTAGQTLSGRALSINAVKALPEVDSAEPNFIYRAAWGSRAPAPLPSDEDTAPLVTPNDPGFPKLWGMLPSISKAWNLAQGAKEVVVAIVDTGIDYNHPDLKANIWSKPNAPQVHGYNAITGSTDPKDDNGHGTHCAGTIGAVGDNGVGVVGVNWTVSLMGVKFLSAEGSGTLADAIKAIDWARQNGANVLSNSWGGGGYSKELEAAITRARDAGIVFVAAAGNDTANNDEGGFYPAGYKVSNVIAVAAMNKEGKLASFSNYGPQTVQIAAPGQDIYSTAPGGGYQFMSGTSMAAPHVSGAAALLLSLEPKLTGDQVKARLMISAEKNLPALKGKIRSDGGKLNVYRLLKK